MSEEPGETGRTIFQMLHHAFITGDLAGVRAALGEPADFPNCIQPRELGCGDHPLEYAIYWSPLSFVAKLLDAGADPNYHAPAGFPSLMAALSTDRTDRTTLIGLLLTRGGPSRPNVAITTGRRCTTRWRGATWTQSGFCSPTALIRWRAPALTIARRRLRTPRRPALRKA